MNKKFFILLNCIILGILNGSFPSLEGQGWVAFAARMQYVEPTEPLTYDPLYVEDLTALHLSSLLYNNLVGTDANFNLQPELLESLTPIKAGNGVYRFKLKSGVQWVGCDGSEVIVLKPFIAQDVVYTFEKIRDSAISTRYDHVKNLFKDVRQVANDEVEFEVKKEKAYLDQDFIIRSLQFAVIPDLSNISRNLVSFKGQPVVGTGPFAMTEEGFNSIRLDKNKKFPWFNQEKEDSSERLEISIIGMNARTDLVPVFQELAIPVGASKLHLMTEIPLEKYKEAKANPNISMPIHGTNSFTYIAYNCGGAFRDKRLRLAFTHAFNRKEVFINVYGDIYPGRENLSTREIPEIIHCPLPPNQTPTDIPTIEYDPVVASRLKKEVMEDEKVGDDVKEQIRKGFDLFAYIENATEDRICQAFATQIYSNLGIKIKVVSMTKSEWFKKIGGRDFEITFGRAVFNQDVNIIDSLFNSTSPQNFLYYRNDEIDRRLDEYARANHPEMRDNIRKEMAKIIAEDVPYTFLYRIPKYAAYRNDSLGEVEIHPYYFFSFVDKWYMKPTSPKRR